MITSQEKSDTVIVGNFESSKFTIKASPKTFHVLSSQLYRYPVKAVVRELCCNAKDSHDKAKNPEPYEVHFPTVLEPYFSVKDNGVGIPHEDMREVFCVYFGSTKEDSNEYIGAFGLGAKSPYTISSSFTVISRYDGFKRTYLAFVDSDNYPSISLLSTEETEEPNGLEVNVPVSEKHIGKFNNAANEVFKYLPFPKANISRIELKKFNVDKELYAYPSEGSMCIVGGISYPVSESSFDKPEHVQLIKLGVAMRFNIGELSIAPSRESLSEDLLTVNAIKKRLDFILEDLAKEYKAVIDSCPSYYKARKKLESAVGMERVGMLSVGTYKDRSLKEIVRERVTVCSIDKKFKYIETDYSNFYGYNVIIMVNDCKFITRIRNYVKGRDCTVVVVTKDQAKKIGLTEAEFVYTSSINGVNRNINQHIGYLYRDTWRKKDTWHPVSNIPPKAVVLYCERKNPDEPEHIMRSMYRYLRTKSLNLYCVTKKSVKENNLDVIHAVDYIKNELKHIDFTKPYVVLTKRNSNFIDLFGLKVENTISEKDYDSMLAFGVRIEKCSKFDSIVTKKIREFPILGIVNAGDLDKTQYSIFKEFFNAGLHKN